VEATALKVHQFGDGQATNVEHSTKKGTPECRFRYGSGLFPECSWSLIAIESYLTRTPAWLVGRASKDDASAPQHTVVAATQTRNQAACLETWNEHEANDPP